MQKARVWPDSHGVDYAFRNYKSAGAARPRASSNDVHGIKRVVYDITSKPPGTVEWE
jgi:GMP synthase (glutamine-hydrolysing)